MIFLWLRNSIGNLSAREASSFLARFVSSNAINHLQFIIGIDGCQNQSQIERCYDPTNPVTRDFLMNGLDQANKVLETSVFREGDWTCMGFFDPTDNVWKSYYVARRNVELNFAEPSIHIAKGERIFAISSAKWTQRQIEKISSGAGFWMAKAWKDEDSVYGKTFLAYMVRSGMLMNRCLRSLPASSDAGRLW